MAATVMLIHGAWLTPSAWDRFRQRFEAAGMDVVVPPWPWLDRPVDALRQSPDPRLAKLGLKQITDHYAALIEAMPQPPIVIGHCFGGLIAQLLADRGLGAAVVAIDPPPPFGVRLHPLMLWNSLCVFLSLNGWNRVLHMPERAFAAAFAQTLPEAEKSYAWGKFIVPAPGRIFFQLLLGIGARVRWDNPDRPPLMLIAGGKDRTVPPAMVRANYRKQLRAPSDTAFHEFPGRSHWLCNEDGWEEVADRALSWARTAAVR